MVRGIMEGTQHAGDIPQGGAFQAPFAQRTGRLTFKVDNNKIFAGIEHLAEVKITMNSEALGLYSAFHQQMKAAIDISFLFQDSFGRLLNLFGQARQSGTHQAESPGREIAHGLVH